MPKEEEMLLELAAAHSNPLDDEMTEELSIRFFKELHDTETAAEYLRITMGQDIKRYFAATSDRERDQIKGHFAFAAFLRGQIVKKDKELKSDPKPKRVVKRANGTIK